MHENEAKKREKVTETEQKAYDIQVSVRFRYEFNFRQNAIEQVAAVEPMRSIECASYACLRVHFI